MRTTSALILASALAATALGQTAHERAVAEKEQAAREKLRERGATRPAFLPTSQTTTGYAADLAVPPMERDAEPAAGRRVRMTLPGYERTEVYYSLYLPTDWQPGKRFPVIVEYQGNGGAISVDGLYDSALGYGQSGGRGFIWVCLPYVNEARTDQQLIWWGDVPATLDFCRRAVREVCERWGGDGSAVLLTGFSRGAIACNYLGLHDDATADLWLAFLPHSHYEGKWPGSKAEDRDAMLARLARLRGRASFVTNEGDAIFPYALETIRRSDAPFTLVPLPRVRHTNTWVLEDCPERKQLRAWLAEVLEKRPGTHDIAGRVVDVTGGPIEGVRVEVTPTRWAITDAEGRYRLRSLTDGARTLRASKGGATIAEVPVTVAGRDVEANELREGRR